MNMETRVLSAAERLLEALRAELQEYGGLLASLDQQQQAVIGRAGDDVLQSVGAVNDRAVAVERARQTRQGCSEELAQLLGQPADADLASITAHLPQKFRPAVQALVRENNQLLVRVRQRARQNHLLISRSMELMQRVLNAFVPSGLCTTYSERGKQIESAPPTMPLYDAVG